MNKELEHKIRALIKEHLSLLNEELTAVGDITMTSAKGVDELNEGNVDINSKHQLGILVKILKKHFNIVPYSIDVVEKEVYVMDFLSKVDLLKSKEAIEILGFNTKIEDFEGMENHGLDDTNYEDFHRLIVYTDDFIGEDIERMWDLVVEISGNDNEMTKALSVCGDNNWQMTQQVGENEETK